MGAVVTVRRYPNRAHTISAGEIDFVKGMILTAFGTNTDNADAR
jgi:hypothetical protein